MKFFFLGFVLLFLGCNRLPRHPTSPFFEGQLTYRQSFIITPTSNLSASRWAQISGTKIVSFIQNGNIRQEFYNTDNQLLEVRIYDEKNNISYSERISEDTIVYYNASTLVFDIEVRKMDRESYQGTSCAVIKVEGTSIAPYFYSPFSATYFISDSISIDPKWWVNYADGGFNQVTEMGQGYILKYIVQTASYTKTVEIEKISPMKLDSKLFLPNSTKPVKELFTDVPPHK